MKQLTERQTSLMIQANAAELAGCKILAAELVRDLRKDMEVNPALAPVQPPVDFNDVESPLGPFQTCCEECGHPLYRDDGRRVYSLCNDCHVGPSDRVSGSLMDG